MQFLQILAIYTLLFSFEGFAHENFFFQEDFKKKANIQDETLFVESDKDFVSFWEKCACDLDWFQKWDKVLDWNPPYAKWFETGKLNVSYNCLDRHIKAGRGDKQALIYINENRHKKVLSYQELYTEVNRLSNVLKKLGVKKGDRVAIYMPMTPEAIASMLACTRIGAVHSVIFGGVGAQSVKDRIMDAEAKVLITADGSFRAGKKNPYKSLLDPILEECSSIEATIVVNHIGSDIVLKKGRDYLYTDVMKDVSDYCEPEAMGAEDPLFILYTSGTTGKPKGILHTTGGYLVGVHTTFKWVFDIKPHDIYWSTADIGWITGHSFVVYGPLSNGVTQVIYEGSFDYPSKNQFAKIIDENHVSIFYTAPTVVRMFMKWGKTCFIDTKLDSLRLIGTIGEPINPESWLWFYHFIGHDKCPIVDTWFQTETGSLVISPLPGVTPLLPGTVTKALPGYKVAVLDEEGNPASKGFLAITQPYPSMMRGIYKDPNRYIATYWSKWNGKYYLAGDAAEVDENGYLWIRGRSDEVLKVSGHRIGTAEIENALIQYPAVSESAVIGVKDAIKGEKIVAFVILKDNSKVEEDIEQQLKQTVATYLGSYVRPDTVVIVDQLPKTRSGKILRRILKNLIEGNPMGNVTTLSDPSCLHELTKKCQDLNLRFYKEEDETKILSSISAPPLCQELDWQPISTSSKALSEKLSPILAKHLKDTNYDRLHLVEQFLGFYLQGSVKPLEALAAFQPDIKVEPWKGTSCYGLMEDLHARLPRELSAKKIPAFLAKRFQQKGWANLSHTALLIKYASPLDLSDRGYILLDPNFDIECPIILKQDGTPYLVDMRHKGVWSFHLEGDRIVCDRKDGGPEWRTVYEIREYLNSPAVAIKPMIATDRRISCVARNEKGECQAHININLDLEEVSWAIGYEKQPAYSFADMKAGKKIFSEEFASKFSLSQKELHSVLLKIINNKPTLDQLRDDYLDLLKKSSRSHEFSL